MSRPKPFKPLWLNMRKPQLLSTGELRRLVVRLTRGEDVPVFCDGCGGFIQELQPPYYWLPTIDKEHGMLLCHDCWKPHWEVLLGKTYGAA